MECYKKLIKGLFRLFLQFFLNNCNKSLLSTSIYMKTQWGKE
jgi:hypothetical protein